MFNEDTDLLFPPRVIASLAPLRDACWQRIVEGASRASETSVERLAFVLTMARLCNCANCNADTYRALHGCSQCAIQTIRRFRGADQELIDLYQTSLEDVENYTEQRKLQ
ncbi:MAG: hypothetical protein JXA13_04905 [Anaerolineales bacterium]|nr:hypothetical protein [Anaerolineales bacterium]